MAEIKFSNGCLIFFFNCDQSKNLKFGSLHNVFFVIRYFSDRLNHLGIVKILSVDVFTSKVVLCPRVSNPSIQSLFFFFGVSHKPFRFFCSTLLSVTACSIQKHTTFNLSCLETGNTVFIRVIFLFCFKLKMAAPFFCTVSVLTADLRMLGYPNIDDPQLLATEGESRTALLSWLAEQVEPTVKFSRAQDVANFWQTLGIHSNDPNAAGYLIPFTAPNRPRDRAAAFVFLRTAIDLVLAVRRQRGDNAMPSWLDNDFCNDIEEGEEGSSTVPLNQFDIDALTQMDALIAQRHTLFPSAAHLLAPPSNTIRPKRPPLSNRTVTSSNIPSNAVNASSPRRRDVSTKASTKPGITTEKSKTNINARSTTKNIVRANTKAGAKSQSNSVAKLGTSHGNASPTTKTGTKSTSVSTTAPAPAIATRMTSGSLPTREYVLDRLRTLRRETADFSTGMSDDSSPCKKAISHLDGVQRDDADQDDTTEDAAAAAISLARSAKAITKLSKRFDSLVDDARAIRAAKGRYAQRDREMESAIADSVPHCVRLMSSTCATVSTLSRIKSAVDALRRGRKVLQSLPGSTALRAIVEQNLRTECHL